MKERTEPNTQRGDGGDCLEHLVSLRLEFHNSVGSEPVYLKMTKEESNEIWCEVAAKKFDDARDAYSHYCELVKRHLLDDVGIELVHEETHFDG